MNYRHRWIDGSSVVQYCSHSIINVAWSWCFITTFVRTWSVTRLWTYRNPNRIRISRVFIRSLYYEARNAWSRSKGPRYHRTLTLTMASQRGKTIKGFVYIFYRGLFFRGWCGRDGKKYQGTNSENWNCFHKYDFVDIKLCNQIWIQNDFLLLKKSLKKRS